MSNIFIDDVGIGFPLVLVHGYLGSSDMWRFQKNFFSKNFRVIAPALPGFGESSKSKSLNSINDMAKFVLKVLKDKKINKFHLLGHSMGGMIVQEILKISNDKVDKLILYATGSVGEIPGRYETMEQTRKKLRVNGIKDTISRVPKNWFVKKDKDKNFFICKKSAKNVRIDTVDNALIAMKNWQGKDYLKNIKNKTLILWGNKDLSYNFDQINILNQNIKNSRLEIFDNCSHNIHLEKVNKFNRVLDKFLKEEIK